MLYFKQEINMQNIVWLIIKKYKNTEEENYKNRVEGKDHFNIAFNEHFKEAPNWPGTFGLIIKSRPY